MLNFTFFGISVIVFQIFLSLSNCKDIHFTLLKYLQKGIIKYLQSRLKYNI